MVKQKKVTCVNHGGNLNLDSSNFYVASEVSVYKGIGYIPICKRCLYEMVNDYYERYKDMRLAIYFMCRKIDIAYNSTLFESAWSKENDNAQKVFQSYITQYNSFGKKNNIQLPFDEGEHLELNQYKKRDSKQKEQEEDGNIVDIVDFEKSIVMTRDDYAIKADIIEMLEFDPFEGYSEADQKFLYNDLYNYLGDEDVVEDQYLVSQIIQIVNNNNQIRKIDFLISKYTASMELLVQNDAKVKSLNSTKKDIAAITDKIAKENEIAVKHRRGSNIRKSSLTVMMDYLRELGFEDAEVDYYDQKKAYGMQRAADISMKAMAEQIQFDENDVSEIIIEQRNLIRDMENKILDLEEENRKLYVEIEKYRKE